MWRSRKVWKEAFKVANSLQTTRKAQHLDVQGLWNEHTRQLVTASLRIRSLPTAQGQRGLSYGRRGLDQPSNYLRSQNPASPPSSGVLKPVVFCAASSAAIFTYAAYVEEGANRRAWAQLRSAAPFGARHRYEPRWLQHLPLFMKNLYREFWLEASPARQAVALVTAANVSIFAVFRGFPSLRGAMALNFIHALPPLPFRARTLLTSNFMHQNPMHLAVNMLAFWSFGTEAARALGAEQFGAFYLSAGLASGLLSHLGRIRSRSGGFSLGASGAVYACFAVSAITRPDTEVVLIFLPWLPINILDAFSVLVAVDVAGALLRWRTFDHLGHLGGALFGWYYIRYGQQEIWPKFQRLAEKLTGS